MKLIDDALNSITMYKLVLYSLILISFVALIFSIFEILNYSPLSLISSLIIILLSCFVTNFILSKFFKVPVNSESFVITAFILFLILSPVQNFQSVYIYILAGVIAMGSKYVIAINRKHIFNPAAFALVVLSLMGASQVVWWVGNSYLFPLVLILGLLIVRKIRKYSMFITFFACGIFSISIFALANGRDPFAIVPQAILSWPILFLGTFMLTEPLTIPPTRKLQVGYGAIVGLLSGSQINIGPFYSTSEMALLVGNFFSYLVSFKKRLVLTFKYKKELSPSIYEFVFLSNEKFNFLPGQYLDWTLGGVKPDARGVRRFFTIASSPTEDEVKLGLRFQKNGSAYKKRLMHLHSGDKIYAGNLAGDFTLPDDKGEKLVFIAGGIGVTPFRSIIKYLIDKKQKRDIVMFYANSNEKDFVYKDIWDSAKKIGVKTILVLTSNYENIKWNGCKGRITAEIIKKEVPDYSERTYYLSGPVQMVDAYKSLLRSLSIKPHKIITDYFPGF